MNGRGDGFTRAAFLAACLFLSQLGPMAGVALAQDNQVVRSPVLVIESDRLFRDSDFGKRIAADVARASAELAAENRRIESELEVEEQALTDQRPSLSPDEFRALADGFDEKVRNFRRSQEAKARALVARQESARAAFLNAAAPVLEDMMRASGAAIMLERRDVFLSVNAIDITQDALNLINEEIGDGSGWATQDDAIPAAD